MEYVARRDVPVDRILGKAIDSSTKRQRISLHIIIL